MQLKVPLEKSIVAPGMFNYLLNIVFLQSIWTICKLIPSSNQSPALHWCSQCVLYVKFSTGDHFVEHLHSVCQGLLKSLPSPRNPPLPFNIPFLGSIFSSILSRIFLSRSCRTIPFPSSYTSFISPYSIFFLSPDFPPTLVLHFTPFFLIWHFCLHFTFASGIISICTSPCPRLYPPIIWTFCPTPSPRLFISCLPPPTSV